MRQLILDTETTGLSAQKGDRIIEIGILEINNRQPTGQHLHFYINPERKIEAGALAVHGLSNDFLADKPKFSKIIDELKSFIAGAEIIIHNAPFDIGFLNAEFALHGEKPFTDYCAKVIDTLADARALFPGKKNSLDALCERLGVNNKHRTLHGALLDAQLLAEVYLAMTRGQESLIMEDMFAPAVNHADNKNIDNNTLCLNLPIVMACNDELNQHEKILDDIEKKRDEKSVWRQLK